MPSGRASEHGAPSNAARPRGIEQLAAALAGVRGDQHDEAAQHRSRDERAGAVMGLRLVGHRYDRSVTRYPAPYVNMAREVRDALVRGQPVVALETTYVSHGFPHPTGVETALASEEAVRAAGAIPATIALMDGEIRVGLRRDDLDRIALEHPRKVSPRDLAATLADGALGATTVAGTIAIARLCGIHHAATGGIGGVHRDAERTFDISADLTELARAQVCLVCSGAKSILDVPRTLEVLETLGIPVVGFGTSTLPLFYCRESEHDVPARVDTADQAAALCRIHWELGATAVLIANPPPAGVGAVAGGRRRADRCRPRRGGRRGRHRPGGDAVRARAHPRVVGRPERARQPRADRRQRRRRGGDRRRRRPGLVTRPRSRPGSRRALAAGPAAAIPLVERDGRRQHLASRQVAVQVALHERRERREHSVVSASVAICCAAPPIGSRAIRHANQRNMAITPSPSSTPNARAQSPHREQRAGRDRPQARFVARRGGDRPEHEQRVEDDRQRAADDEHGAGHGRADQGHERRRDDPRAQRARHERRQDGAQQEVRERLRRRDEPRTARPPSRGSRS